MANTYTQLYVQIVFSVKNKDCLIEESFREEVQKHISEIISNRKCKLYAIYINPDHAHIFVSMKPYLSLSDLVRAIKAVSSKYINEQGFTSGRFQWQDGFGAFTYSHSQLMSVVHYIHNQPAHHENRGFKEEYIDFLQKFSIEFDERYLLD